MEGQRLEYTVLAVEGVVWMEPVGTCAVEGKVKEVRPRGPPVSHPSMGLPSKGGTWEP